MKHKFVFFIGFLGYCFLYMPIVTLVIFSFNDSKLINIWGGFSFRWYKEIMHDSELIMAVGQSLKIAVCSACLGVVLGTCAGIVLSKINFPFKRLFSALIPIPLLVPEIIIGISMLILFQTLNKIIGWPESQGSMTVIISHATVCMSYVAFLIQLHMRDFNKAGSIEEAALDLGASPFKVFLHITYPLIKPTIISGWVLSFILSFDDLIIASFTTGSGTTTLPMLIYSRIRFGLNPEINVIGAITILLGLITVFSGNYLRKNKNIFNLQNLYLKKE